VSSRKGKAVDIDTRLEHYEGKMKNRLPKDQIQRYKERTRRYYEMEKGARQFIHDLTVPMIARPYYLDVARESWKLSNAFIGDQLATELRIVKMKWKERGLDPSVVDKVIEFVLKRREVEKG